MNRKIGRAMHDYRMLADKDRVLIGVSGGMDSLALAWVLSQWVKKTPIDFEMTAIHIDMDGSSGPGQSAHAVSRLMAELEMPLIVLPAAWKPAPAEKNLSGDTSKDICFRCARSRRTQMFAYARDHAFTTLALGHHRDDILETFFLNLTCAGNISTMRPRQDLFSGRLAVIRPLAYCDKDEVNLLGETLGLEPVDAACPLAGNTRRQEVHELMDSIYRRLPGSKEHIFAALGNVRQDYLLLPPSKRSE